MGNVCSCCACCPCCSCCKEINIPDLSKHQEPEDDMGLRVAGTSKEDEVGLRVAETSKEDDMGLRVAETSKEDEVGLRVAETSKEDDMGFRVAETSKEDEVGLRVAETSKEDEVGLRVAETSKEPDVVYTHSQINKFSNPEFKERNEMEEKSTVSYGCVISRCVESWDTCIESRSESDAKILLEKKILPSNSELNKASRVFGRSSTIFSNICSVISHHIINVSENVIHVCPSYKADNASIVFIVFLDRLSPFSVFKDYEYYKIHEDIRIDNEYATVHEFFKSENITRNQSDDKDFEQLRKCINKNADDLLKRHSNLNVILPSLKKSVGYKSGQHEFIEEPCIVLFVTVKGLIPFAEEGFKKDIDGFRTDVLEGELEPYFGGPREFHEHLKIGLAIQANNIDGSMGSMGTLGGFIEHPLHGLCGITCAHVIYTHVELQIIKENTPFEMGKLVHQPTVFHNSFGKVVHVVYNEGDDHMSGMEVAIFSIQDRKPKDGSFPKVFNDMKAGFDDDHPLCFNSGDVCEMANIKPRTEVYKLGISTGITRGSFELQGATVRRRHMQGHCQSFGFYLKDQIVILPIGHFPFAFYGDSGALVLMEGEQDSVAIGIVEGGMHGLVFVTPICDILRAAGCKELKMCQFKTE